MMAASCTPTDLLRACSTTVPSSTAGAALAIASNGLCMLYQDYPAVLWLGVFAGLGSGIYTAVAVATLGGSGKPARAYNMMLFAFAFSQALEMHVLPQLSMNGIYLAFIGLYVFSLGFLRWVPARPLEPPLDVDLDVLEPSGAVFLMAAGFALVGMAVYGVMYLWLRRMIPALANAR